MDIKPDFAFKPLPELEHVIHFPFPHFKSPLGPLLSLAGTWEGAGFNTIWRPFHGAQDRFLELNLTAEVLQFTAINGEIPNRGLLQDDINMFGLTYLQQIKDSNLNAGLHIEPGIWATVPQTTSPAEPATVVRMASIPHGTVMLAQGTATSIAGPPGIPNNNINPFPIGTSGPGAPFSEQDLSTPTAFRSSGAQMTGITQGMVNNPNSVLQTAIAGQTITHTVVLDVTTSPTPVQGGGTANTAFLKPNADAAHVKSTFWIETVQGPGATSHLQLQYSQNVDLNFNGLTWPHVSVATLKLTHPIRIDPRRISPLLPEHLLREMEGDPPRK